jgi:regulator of sigma E protease
MNLVFPIFVLAGVYMVGVPTATSLFGGVVPRSPAAEAGLEPGDRIVAIGGEEIWRWRDVTRLIGSTEADRVDLVIEREGERRSLSLEPERESGRARIGVDHSPPAVVVSVQDRDGLAARAGLRSGDRVVSVNGVAVDDWYGFDAAIQGATTLELELARPLGEDEETIRTGIAAADPLDGPEALGLRVLDSEILLVEAGSPAERAGVEKEDLIVAVDGAPLESFQALADRIRTGEGEAFELTVLRGGRDVAVLVEPEQRAVQRDGDIVEAWAIGIHGGARRVSGEVRSEVERNPLAALWTGTERTAEIFALTVFGIAKLVSGSVGLENVAGPIGIGKIAADSYEESWFQFFWVMAVISVNLAILNLLPIPILDGGQICFAVAEGIKGKPLSFRVREIAQQVGLSILVVLMGFAFWNDLSRYWSRIVGFLQGL